MNGRPTPFTGRGPATDGEFPCDPCGGTGRVPDVPVQAYAEDEAERGETLYDWIVAELAALFEPGGEAGE